MHNLVIDIGNTQSKVAVFKQKKMVSYQLFDELQATDVINLIKQYEIENSILSTVKKQPKDLIEILTKNTHYHLFTTNIKAGIRNHYKTIQTLGLDRWAKVIAANKLYKNKTCLLIDAGTCITYDVINADSNYLGGSISLGIDMRLKALNQYTAALPLVSRLTKTSKIPKGKSTETAILNGVLQGLVFEVTGFISENNSQYSNCKVIITGGDADFLRSQLKKSIFASQITYNKYLVLKGLNEVIRHKHV